MAIHWIIPDVPRKLSERIRQEAYFTNEIIIKQEMIRARGTVRGAQAARVYKSRISFYSVIFINFYRILTYIRVILRHGFFVRVLTSNPKTNHHMMMEYYSSALNLHVLEYHLVKE